MRILWCMLIILAGGCNHGNELRIEEYTINHHLRPAQGFIPTMSLMVKPADKPNQDWNNLFFGIDGFDFEWGFEYRVAVLITPIENPLADGPGNTITLLEEISKTKVADDTTFELRLQSGLDPTTDFAVSANAQDYSLLGSVQVDCQDLCGELTQLLAGDTDVIGTFEHVDNETVKLVAVRSI